MEKQHRTFAQLIRGFGVIIALAGVAVVAVPPAVMARQPELMAWVGLAICLACCVALWGIAALLVRGAQVPPEVHSALSRIQHQAMDLQGKLNDLYMMSDRASRAVQAANREPKDYTEQLDHLAAAIQELRELSLLPDVDRRLRADSQRQMRKASLVNELFALVGAAEWARAERLLISLQTEFPNDDEVAKGRDYLEHARRLVEEQSMKRATNEIEELMLASSWQRAWQRAKELIEGFPTNPDARVLFNRVKREYETYCDTSAQHMFESIRHHIDQRNWRNALSEAEKLMQQFPSHRLAENLKLQIRTLRDNAEIQERQELEVRIQELMHDGQFGQAIELAEDVIHRFPDSPQAESLETLLPKIRELAGQTATAPEAP